MAAAAILHRWSACARSRSALRSAPPIAMTHFHSEHFASRIGPSDNVPHSEPEPLRVLHGRKIQMRRHLLPRWRNRGLSRIESRPEHSFVQLLIALANFVLLVFQELLQIAGIFLDGVREIDEVKGQHLGIGQPHDRRAHGLGEGPPVDKVVVGKCVYQKKSSYIE